MQSLEQYGDGVTNLQSLRAAGRKPALSRRSFLLGSAAVAATPALGEVPRSGIVDVVIVGAGAAGIAAARRLATAGKQFVLVEATGRVGGRCLTDTRLFGVPYDIGAHWIHAPGTNPLVNLAANAGLEVYRARPQEWLRIGNRYASAAELDRFLSELTRANRAINKAGHNGGDVSCAQALPKDLGDLRSTIEFVLGPFSCAKDLDEVSAADFVKSSERERDAFCRQGFGTILMKLAEGAPLLLSTPVTRINYADTSAAVVETTAGTFKAQAVIVTASVAVLAAEKLKFTPALPLRHREALAKLELGSYDHIALELAGNPLNVGSDELIYEKAYDGRTAALLGNVAGTPLCLIEVGGRFGRSLADQGDAAMIDFAIGWLANLYGARIRAAVKRSHATRWNRAPWSLGAFSSASPGNQPARRVLAESLNNRVWFAGEAVDEAWWGTVGGAWESGERAADAVIKRLGYPD
jgi:monoamine oxidase